MEYRIVPPPRDAIHQVVNDRHYDGLRAQDGTDISTRAKHRQYMKDHGLTTADDYTESWKKAAQEREAFYKGESREHRKDVRRSMEEAMRRLINK